MTDNIHTSKYKLNDAIENEPKFDSSLNLSSGTKDSLPVVTINILGGKKNRGMTVAGLA